MSAAIRLRLLPGDYAAAVRKSASGCLIAVALRRQYGGEWTVDGRHAEMAAVRGRWRLGRDARGALRRFDAGLCPARRRAVTVTLYGPPVPPPERIRRPWKARAAAGGGIAVAGLTAGGYGWDLLAAAGVLLAAAAGVLVLAWRWRSRPPARDRPPVPPQWPHAPAMTRERDAG